MDRSFKEQALDLLKKAGSRITKPRLAVIDCFEASQEPMTAKDIVEIIEAREKSKDVDLVTTYRVLERLKELGLIHQIANSGRFVACASEDLDSTEIHVLLRCKICSKVDEQCLPAHFLGRFFDKLEESFGFVTEQEVFEIEGTCKLCRV